MGKKSHTKLRLTGAPVRNLRLICRSKNPPYPLCGFLRARDEPLQFWGGFFVVPHPVEIPNMETSPPDFLSDDRFIKERLPVFVLFMGRDGYSEQMATEAPAFARQ